jgi:hypothetical protein
MLRRHGVRFGVLSGMLAVMLLLPGIAAARPPFMERFSWQDAPEFFADCAAWGYGDYMIVGQSSGFGSWKFFEDKDGNLVRAHLYLHIDNTIMRVVASTGEVQQTWRDVGRHTDFFWEFNEFGPTMQKRAGVTYIIHDPDGGVILHDTGSIVFSFNAETGEVEIVHAGGPHDVFTTETEEEFVNLFCTTFGPDN